MASLPQDHLPRRIQHITRRLPKVHTTSLDTLAHRTWEVRNLASLQVREGETTMLHIRLLDKPAMRLPLQAMAHIHKDLQGMHRASLQNQFECFQLSLKRLQRTAIELSPSRAWKGQL